MKNKIDRSVGLRYDIYKTKKVNLDQKLSSMPRKLSPIRKHKVINDSTYDVN